MALSRRLAKVGAPMAPVRRTFQAHQSLAERLPRQLRLSELRVFVAVLESRSFRKAASALHVTQPAVTKAIAGLEELLGARLFDRGANGVELTVHGASFAPHATALFDELRTAARDLEWVSRGEGGVLRVGTTPMPSLDLIGTSVHTLLQTHRGIFVRVDEAREQELIDRLRRGELDVALVRSMRAPDAEDLDVERLWDMMLCVYAARHHPLASRPVVSWAEACRYPWVRPPPDVPFRNAVERVLASAGLPMPPHAVESGSVHMQYAMVLHGSMLSFGLRPDGRVAQSRDLLVRLPLALPPVGAAIFAVTLRRRGTPPLAEQLIALVRSPSGEA
jgi:DNA-binding transcriptional LysR family regulator